VGLATPIAFAIATAGVLAGSLIVRGGLKPAPSSTARVPLAAVAVGAPLLILIAAYGLTHSPLTAYDSLSYHLFFPGRWLQEHGLSIIPTPFSDEAQAYAPANGEVYFLWLMLPIHGDLLARVGQIPFLIAIGAALYGLARRMGARPVHAVYPALLCLASRPIVEQAVGADVDLICWALFLSSLYIGLAAVESGERRDWLLWGVSVGLYLGTKYVALVYSPILLAFVLARGPKRHMLWALPGIAAFALPWYLRNWLVAGSPLYPASVAIAGMTIARGAYSRAAMLFSVFHTTDFRLFPVMAAHAFGVTLILGWFPFAALGVWSIIRRGPRWPGLWIVLAPIVMAALFWFGVPDNVDSRFLLPAAMVGLVPVAFVFKSDPKWNAAVHALYVALILFTWIGLRAELPATLPWFMGGWLSLEGIVAGGYLWLVLALAVAMGLLWLVTRRWRVQNGVITAAIIILSVVLTRGSYLQTTSIFLRSSFFDAWRWVGEHVPGSTIAYTGNNVPYPLMGPHLTNRVYYVNTDRHLDWRLHDYDRAVRARRDPEGQAPLATSSGVLLPLPAGAKAGDAVRPRYSRMGGDPEAWIRNLRTLRVDHVFISALSAYEIDYMWHDAGGFPIEDKWARADPRFTIVYENPQVRIYAVSPQ
jgi:dolichyl-phosphate-mannose-protein mannosyltransferase